MGDSVCHMDTSASASGVLAAEAVQMSQSVARWSLISGPIDSEGTDDLVVAAGAVGGSWLGTAIVELGM